MPALLYQRGRGQVTAVPDERAVRVGQPVEIFGLGNVLETVCTAIEAFNKPLEQGKAGQNVGLLLRGYALSEMELVNRWVDAIFEGVQHVVPPLFQLLGEMEVYLALLAFKDAAEQRGLAVCLPALSDAAPDQAAQGAGVHRFEGLFNPLLFSLRSGSRGAVHDHARDRTQLGR